MTYNRWRKRKQRIIRGRFFRDIPFIVAGTYAALSAAWIVLSDSLASSIATSAEQLHQIQTYKGVFFISVSALLMLAILRFAWNGIYAAFDEAHESEGRLEMALSSAGGGIWETDLTVNEQNVFVSSSLADRLGFPAEHRLSLDEIGSRRHPDDVEPADKAFSDLVAGNTRFLETRYRVLAADGTYHWLHTRGTLERDEAGTPRRLMGVSLDVTEQVEAEERVSQLLRFDPLTGLPKPKKFLADIDQALAEHPDCRLAVVQVRLADLDQLLGEHETAEDAAIVRAIGDRLQEVGERRISASRVATDVFAIATPPMASTAEVHIAVEKVLAKLCPSPAGRAQTRLMTGGAVYPRDGTCSAVLLRNSGHALEKADRDEPAVRWFTEGLDEEVRRRNELRRDLAHAVANGEIECRFQPLVELATGRTAGFEALARWRRPDGETVTPDVFIPLAEEFGHIVPLGEEVLRQACVAALGWPADDGEAPFVAVNVSALQLEKPDFSATVARVLAETGLSPRRLELEVTESTLAGNPDAAAARLEELRSLGVSVAIDDFGTGYSSLSLLSRLPFSRLKIDRSFVAEYGRTREATTIVNTIVDLCGMLEIRITAEGIETPEQAALLREMGIELGQGFFFARPAIAAETGALAAVHWEVPAGAQALRPGRQAARSAGSRRAVPGNPYFGR